MSFFEIGMLVCFGAAWPVNILKSLKSRTAAGKSLIFQWVILVGYICGITHKLLYSMDFVLVLYLINFAMVTIDTVLICINQRRDRMRAAEKAA